MGKSKWKDRPGVEPEPCGCRYQITKANDKPIRDRIKHCSAHAPKKPEQKDKYNGVPDSALYWW